MGGSKAECICNKQRVIEFHVTRKSRRGARWRNVLAGRHSLPRTAAACTSLRLSSIPRRRSSWNTRISSPKPQPCCVPQLASSMCRVMKLFLRRIQFKVPQSRLLRADPSREEEADPEPMLSPTSFAKAPILKATSNAPYVQGSFLVRSLCRLISGLIRVRRNFNGI